MGGSVPEDPPAMRHLAGLRLQESFGASVPKADTDQERFAGRVVPAIERRRGDEAREDLPGGRAADAGRIPW